MSLMSSTILPSKGNRLKMFRSRAGKCKLEVAKYLGIDLTVYEDYEEGVREVPDRILLRCSSLFNAPELKMLLSNKSK